VSDAFYFFIYIRLVIGFYLSNFFSSFLVSRRIALHLSDSQIVVDGGASKLDFLLQFQADIAHVPVRMPAWIGFSFGFGFGFGFGFRFFLVSNWFFDLVIGFGLDFAFPPSLSSHPFHLIPFISSSLTRIVQAMDVEATSRGAALAAGAYCGLYDLDSIARAQSYERTFSPQMGTEEQLRLIEGWDRAVKMTCEQ
jgi:glycerol kinase